MKISFPGASGDALDARLDLPIGTPRALVLFAHCFTCGKDIVAASRVSAGLVDEGFGVLRFDFTGLGSSDGEFANTNFSSNVDDLLAAAAMLRERYAAPKMLIGHSLGGSAALAAARRIPEVDAVVTIGAPSDPEHVASVFPPDVRERIELDGQAEVNLAGRRFSVKRQFLHDISRHSLDEAIAHLDAALLVMHSPVDEIVAVDHARHIYTAARHPKSFITLDGADHLLTRRPDSAYVAQIVSVWASRYLPESAEGGETQAVEPGTVTVEETGPGRFSQRVVAGNHTFVADEPVGVGDDTGPNPYDFLLAALGACTSMTLRMYADRKKIPLEHVHVTLRHSRIHSEDCADRSPRCRVDVIERDIVLRGALSDEQVASLSAIADKCPVHRTLTGELRVVTTVDGTSHDSNQH